MKGAKYDMVKRTDHARKANRRAEIRLARKFNEAGGLDDEMKYHMLEMKRQQEQLRRELQGLRFEYKKIENKRKQSQGVIYKAQPNVKSEKECDDVTKGDNDDEITCIENQNKTEIDENRHNDYGSNYFGYHSAPGSNKTHNKSVKELERSIASHTYKSSNEYYEEKTKKKLKIQKKENKEVQEKVDDWKEKQKIRRRKFSSSTPLNLRHLSFLRNELIHKEEMEKHRAISSEPTFEEKKISNDNRQRRRSQVVTPPDIANVTFVEDISENDGPKGKVLESNQKENKVQLPNIQRAEDLEFDVNMYAPDGRVRTAHKLPDFTTAFEEARKAKYVRTKYKREFEIALSVNQMFGK